MACEHNGIVKHRNKTLLDFESWLTSQRTNPTIISCFVTILNNTNATSFHDVMSAISSDAIDLKAAAEQDLIGKTNFWLGRLSRFWKESQRRYLSSMYPTNFFSADAWMKRLLCKIYRIVKSIWQYRCDEIHGLESILTSKRDKAEIEKEIRHQYSLGTDGLRAADKHLLSTSLTSMLHASTKEQKYWLRTLRISRAFIRNWENNMFVGMRHVMKTWTRPPD